MSACPRCSEPLAAAVYHGVDVGLCPECSGVLVDMPQLVPLLEGMLSDLGQQIDVNTDIAPVDDVGSGLHCPGCTSPMETFGYLDGKTAQLDRCSACQVLWIDPAELGAAALLYGRTMQRVDDTSGTLGHLRSQGMDRYSRLTMANAVSDRLASFLT